MSIPFFSAGRQIHSRATSITKTWTANQGGRGQVDWMNLVERAGSLEAVPERGEETGGPSGVLTRITPEIGEGVELPAVVRVRKDLSQSGVGHTESNHHLAVLMQALPNGGTSGDETAEPGRPGEAARSPLSAE